MCTPCHPRPRAMRESTRLGSDVRGLPMCTREREAWLLLLAATEALRGTPPDPHWRDANEETRLAREHGVVEALGEFVAELKGRAAEPKPT